VVGNVMPSFEGAWSNTFTLLRNLRVATLIDGKSGFYLYNNTEFFRETQLVRSNRRLDPTILTPEQRLRRYGNQTAGQPAFVQENGASTTVNETRDEFLQKGDFVRFRELSFTYTLPGRIFGRARVQNATVGVAFQNIGLWTEYGGPDPEVISSSLNAGIAQFSRADFLTLPNPRRTLFRAAFTF
jgi:hypothetical protein